MNEENRTPPFFDDGSGKNNINLRTEELYRVNDRVPNEEGIFEAPGMLTVRGIVFPQMVSPIYIENANTLSAILSAQAVNQTVIAFSEEGYLKTPGVNTPAIGVELAVGRLLELQDGSFSALVQSRRRVEILDIVQAEPFIILKARPIIENFRQTQKLTALMRVVKNLFKGCVELDESLPEEAYMFSLNINDPGWLSDMIATTISLSDEQRIELLNLVNPITRLKRLNKILADEMNVLMLEEEIQSQVQTEVDKTQREFYLREQLKVIQNELGEGDIWSRELVELLEKIEKTVLPDDARKQINKEMERLKQMPPMAPEVGIIRNYIDWILELPWHQETDDNLSVAHAQKVLEEYHYGLQKAKDRILEYIAVKSLKPKKNHQPILCFVGPPGTGKTSLGKSIAQSLGREFVRVSLGGVRDEAEIRGHRRTYIGAMPGRIIQTMRRAGSLNPLFMLDEIDKLGTDFRGDPSSALLEVLDPEQNYAYSDHYLELAYDLSKVLFITTANSIMTIPPALLDRMELIEFSGYIEEEKIEIAKRFLIPRQMEETGLEGEKIIIQTPALKKIIREYTYEAGVRNLEREIGSVLRKVARAKSEGKNYPRSITESIISRYLGPIQFFANDADEKDEIGVATAMAWTENGGEIMPVEVLILDGKGNLQITGQVGEVMQESAQAALSYLKSKAEIYKIEEEFFESVDIHMHVPEGAIPKDGPSAGITIAAAITSAVTQIPVRHDIAMTGEITLRGRVLPVGGIREKVLAAHRAGMKIILIPKKNEKDLVEIPAAVKKDLKLIGVGNMDEVLSFALVEMPVETKSRNKKVKRQNKENASEKSDAH